MHFFGLWGTFSFFIGLLLSIYLIISKFVDPEYALTNRPAFFLALTLLLLGSQLFLAGFMGELIARNSAERNSYLIEKKLGV